MSRVSVAFVDDHPVLLDGLVSIFNSRCDYSVVGTGRNAGDAVTLAGNTRPDVMVIDLNMPGDAFDAIPKISQCSPSTKVLVFTASVGIDSAVKALEAGVKGYVLKGSTFSELTQALDSVLSGQTYIHPSLASKVIMALRGGTPAVGSGRPIKLSVREDQIIRLLLVGRTNREIALQLNISEKTVKHYMTVIMQKLHVRNRVEVIIAAQKMGGEYGRRPDVLN